MHAAEGSVSVVVITRDRPRDLEVCLNAVLASAFQSFDLVVVDQSAHGDSAALVGRLAVNRPRLRHIPDTGVGAARARNLGAANTTGEIVVFTDDDCEPDPAWLGSLVGALQADPSAGIVYGAVIPAAHDPRDGFIVGFSPIRRVRLRGRLAKLRDAGISANVALRRSALQATGGFDEMLGPGSYFPCAEDFDLTYRVLLHGYGLLHLPAARVVHHGLRDWRSGSALMHRTYIAIAAAYMKHVRLWDAVGLALLLQEIWRAVANIVNNVAHRRAPVGLRRLSGLLVGVFRSFELEVDPRRAIYRRPS